MFTLKLDEVPDEGLSLQWTEERAILSDYLKNFSHIDFDFETPLTSEVKIRKSNRSLFLEGRVETLLRLHCVRCLKEFSYPLSSNFELTLYPLKGQAFAEEIELEEEEMTSGFFEGEDLRLSEIACEQVFLEIPYQPLCHQDCKGLCPLCGQDLNFSSCTCEKKEFTSAFSVLKDLKF